MNKRASEASVDNVCSIAPVGEDFLEHDCKTIKKFTIENLRNEPWAHNDFKINKEELYSKYNHAYGIVTVGAPHFTEEAMLRACYLIR